MLPLSADSSRVLEMTMVAVGDVCGMVMSMSKRTSCQKKLPLPHLGRPLVSKLMFLLQTTLPSIVTKNSSPSHESNFHS
jgi:hypothetical protein